MFMPFAAFGRSSPGEKKVITGCLPVLAIIVGLVLIICSFFTGPTGESEGTSLSMTEAGMLSIVAGLSKSKSLSCILRSTSPSASFGYGTCHLPFRHRPRFTLVTSPGTACQREPNNSA